MSVKSSDDFRDIWLRMDRDQREQLAADVMSTYKYLQKIAGGFGSPSRRLADRLKARLPRMTRVGFDRAIEQAGKRMQR